MADIDFKIGGDNDEFLRALNQSKAAASSAASGIGSSFGGMTSALESARGAMGGFVALLASVSVGAFVAKMKEAISSMAELDDMAEITGNSVEDLSAVLNTLGPAGHSADTLQTALVRMTKAMTQADDESKDAAIAMKQLGVSATDAQGNLRPSIDVLTDIARSLNQYDDGANKTALAVAILGKQGASLLPLLKDLATMQRQNSSVSSEAAANAEKFEKQLGLLKQQAVMFGQRLAADVLPKLNELVTQFVEGKEAAGGFFNALVRYGLTLRGPVDQIAHLGDKMAELRKQIAEDERLLGTGKMSDGRAEDLRQRIASAKAELAQLEKDKAMYEGQAKRAGLIDDANEMTGGAPQRTKGQAPRPPAERDKAAEARAKAEAEAVLSYQRETAQLDRLSAVEKTQWEIQSGKFRDFSAATKARLLDLAKIEDAQARENKAAELNLKMLREREDAAAKADKEAADAAEKEAKRLDDLAEKWKNVAEPTRVYMQQLQEIRDLVDRGKLSPEQGVNAEFDVQNKMQDALDGKGQKDPKLEYVSTLQSAFSQLFSSIRSGSISAQGVMVGAFNIAASAVSNALASISAKWLAEQLVGKVSALKTALTDIQASAARAGAGAYAATAAIPYVGPAMAPGAAVTAYEGALAFAAPLATAAAEGGFDIPSGANPVTQLHQREMVLPAHIADPLRESLAGGGMGGQIVVPISMIDAKSGKQFLESHGDVLFDLVKRAVREGRR